MSQAGEEELRAELAAARQELDQFCYSISHDLLAPLRQISQLAEHLAHEDQLSPRGRILVKHVVSGTERMRSMVDGLLALSRAGRMSVHTETVDLAALARRLEPSVIAPERLEAQADPALLEQLLGHLLNNAAKFSSNGRIEFGVRDGAYFVKDNGAGFDPAHADKLFSAFQRLHSESEFPGSGLGLATAARLAARHGGRIWADSQPGQGATFFFTLGDSGTL